ncbi:MAG: hypothetical protein M1375_04040, partial [Candidatus Thermoplasmatota archaeon]|nr:hypothetical protein [Candidatus Thermoplasmatota archaeon]
MVRNTVLDARSDENCLYRSDEPILSKSSHISWDSRLMFIDLDSDVPSNHVSSELAGKGLTTFDTAIEIVCIDSFSVRFFL